MIVGVDIGGTKIAAAGFVVDGAGVRRVTEALVAPTPAAEGGDAIVHAVAEAVRAVAGHDPVTAVGIGTAGVVDPDGTIFSATDAIRGWVGFPLRQAVTDAVGAPVSVVNDVHAAALAEAAVGAGAGADGMLMVAVGTGIGGAVVRGDGLVTGVTGTAGSVGHIEVVAPPHLAGRRCPCGGVDHVEAFASGPGMERTYRDETGASRTLREVSAAAAAGDPVARRVIDEGARLLGRGLASANAVLDLETIVVGGGVAEIGAPYLSVVASAYREFAMPGPARARVVAASLGTGAALAGAALLARTG